MKRLQTSVLVAALALAGHALAQSARTDPAWIAPTPGAREPMLRSLTRATPHRVALAPTIKPAVPPVANASGYIAPAPAGASDAGAWRQTGDRTWTRSVELASKDAAFLRVRFGEDFDESVRVFIYDPVVGYSFGPYRRHELARTDWWSTIIVGDRIGIEMIAEGVDLPPPAPSISQINHGYATMDAFIRGGCAHQDVSCFGPWLDTAAAVCVLGTINGAGNVSTFCTGALLNRAGSDGSPLVMTANHCLGSQAAAAPTVYVWFYRTDSCMGVVPDINGLPRSDGSRLVKRHVSSDWNLVGLYEPPATGTYLGWNAGSWDDGPATGIHHPGGTFKRISIGSKVGDRNQQFCGPNNQNCFNADVWDVSYLLGFTQPGSSGSPVFSSFGVVRGTLSGGPSDDCTVSRYGRFDLAFANLRYYLNDIANPSHVNGGVPGDPGNNGNLERGSVIFPFNTVHEATFAVPAGAQVTIAPGDYNEQFTIWRPMTLTRDGSSGIVRIGD